MVLFDTIRGSWRPNEPDRERPVIGFLTDFGLDGAAAICRGVMLSIARDAQIVDISHTVAKYAIRDGAYLLCDAPSRGCPSASTWPSSIPASGRTVGRSRC